MSLSLTQQNMDQLVIEYINKGFLPDKNVVFCQAGL